MKKFNAIFMMVLLACIFQGCTGSKNNSKAETDSAATAAPGAVSEEDSKFVVEAAGCNIAGVEVSYSVKDKLTDAQVKNLAERLIRDHARANEELMAIAKIKGIPLSTSLNGDGQQAEDELAQYAGNALNRAYIDQMVKNQERAIKLYEAAAADVSDTGIRSLAKKELPILNEHLQALNAVHATVK